MRYMRSAALLLILTQPLAGCATTDATQPLAIPWDTAGNAGTSPPTDFLGTTDSEELVLKTGLVEAMRILPSNSSLPGLVGIGTTSPEHQLQVNGSISIYGLDGDTSLFFGQESPTTTTSLGEWGIQYWPAALGGGGLNFWKPSGSSVAGFGNNYLFLSDNGNVGTGTSTPNEQLEITKNFRLPASTASVGVIKSGPNRYIHNYGTNNFFAGVNAGNLNATLTGNLNTGVGADALRSLTTGVGNTAVGGQALIGNMAGSNNTAVGYAALTTPFVGANNVAVGTRALKGSMVGSNNTAVGVDALGGLQGGGGNTVLGFNAGNRITSSQSNSIFLGANAGSDSYAGANNIDIGNKGVYSESGTIRIGTPATHTKTFIAGINGVGVGPAFHVCVDGSHQLGVCGSSLRLKEHIEDMGADSEVLYRLRPVSFLYKAEYGGSPDRPQFGLIAEEVAEVAPALVGYDEQGQLYTVNDQFLAPMLLNELQRKDAELKELRARLEVLEKLVKGLKETMSK